MKETGVVRRIDELGRIVIPKEIRKRLRVKTGDSVDIYTEEDKIILKKYCPISDYEATLELMIEIFKKNTGLDYIICSNSHVIVSTITELEKGEELLEDFTKLFNKSFDLELQREVQITSTFISRDNLISKRIILDGDTISYVIALSNHIFVKSGKDSLDVISQFIEESEKK